MRRVLSAIALMAMVGGGVLMVSGVFFAVPARAQETPVVGLSAVELGPREVNIWEHRLGPESGVHLTTAEYQEFRGPGRYRILDDIEFEIVVSENGRVDSATVIDGAKLHVDEAQQIELARVFKPWMRDGVPIRVKLKDSVQLLPPEQWAAERVPFPDPWDLNTATIVLKRTVCYGSCPEYTVTITGDGTVQFRGGRAVLIRGDHIAHIKPEAVRELVFKFRDADFLSAKDIYRSNWTDNPTQTITLTVAGRTKTVVDYVGTDAGLPLAIRNLEGEIDEVAGTARWVKGDERTLASLEEEGWAFEAATKENITLYAAAISRKNTPLVERYLKANSPIVSADPEQASPVCVATGTGDIGLVRRMLEPVGQRGKSAAQVTVPAEIAKQCLWTAARSGEIALLDLWIGKGADPTAPPPNLRADWQSKYTLLANGVMSGKAAMVRRLLQYKPDLQAPVDGSRSSTILTYAMSEGGRETPEIVAALAKAGADVNARGWRGATAIFEAQFDPATIQPLVAAGADVEVRDVDGKTALLSNAWNERVVRALLAAGADPTAVAKNGDTALKVAKHANCPACATLIEEALKKRAAAANAR